MLNAVLFLLIGLELIAMSPDPRLIVVGALAIPLVLAARGLSVVAPLLAIRSVVSLDGNALPILLWGGLRGGISVALALSLPAGPGRTIILMATYVVVLFSVIIQGSSIGPFIKRFAPKGPCAPVDA